MTSPGYVVPVHQLRLQGVYGTLAHLVTFCGAQEQLYALQLLQVLLLLMLECSVQLRQLLVEWVVVVVVVVVGALVQNILMAKDHWEVTDLVMMYVVSQQG